MVDAACEDIFAIPKDVIFPDELNRYLRDQIATFVRENALLRKNVDEFERKCAHIQKDKDDLSRKLKEHENPTLPPFLSSSQTISSKIVELSKNYREKCAELEKYKTKCSKLVCHLEELKKKENEGINNQEPAKHDTEISELKRLQEKLNGTTNKMLELKNANIQLKTELRQANKLLQRETGEDFNSLQTNSTWKGRAQIISDLQERNKKFKEKLRNLQEQGSVVEIRNTGEKISSKISALEKENAELKSQNEVYKTKIESLRSRCSMLETEHQDLKLKIQNEKDKSIRDLELIADISRQLAEAEQIKRSALRAKNNDISKLNMELENLRTQIENYKTLVENLKARKENSNNYKTENDIKNQVDTEVPENIGNCIQRLEGEKEKLLELINIHKKRLEKERDEHEKFQQFFRLEKQKTIKLEAAVAKSELDSASSSRSNYSTLNHTSRNSQNNLQNQLEFAEETIKALQARLQLEQNERKQDFHEFAQILSQSKHVAR